VTDSPAAAARCERPVIFRPAAWEIAPRPPGRYVLAWIGHTGSWAWSEYLSQGLGQPVRAATPAESALMDRVVAGRATPEECRRLRACLREFAP
jgi:hypothetical protein